MPTKMNDDPLLLVMMIAVGIYVAWLWSQDLKARRLNGTETNNSLPGATMASKRAVLIAACGAALILGAETWGEIALGLDTEQSKMTILFGIHTLLAAITEEVIFRGYIVVERRGKIALWSGIFGASLLFAALHPFLWAWDDSGFAFTFTEKGWFSFAAVFVGSLWFYLCRFATWNPNRSLLPCFAAHLTKNAGVFLIKATQGFVVGIW